MTTLISSEIADIIDLSQFEEEKQERIFEVDEFMSFKSFFGHIGKCFRLICQLNIEDANNIVLHGCGSKLIIKRFEGFASFEIDSVEITENYFANPTVEILGKMIITDYSSGNHHVRK